MIDDVRRRAWLVAFAAGGLMLAAPAAGAEPGTVVGRAVSVHGNVFAKAPGEPKRRLSCRDPILEGDQIQTEEDSGIGVDSGTFYVRLGERSTLEVSALASGAPRIDLARGHVRLIDSAGPGNASAEVTTPGLLVARTGPDLDALVFSEKAGAVSMVCAYERGVDVARRAAPGERLTAAPGGCVVSKPREALYAADATHPTLAVLMNDACEEVALAPVADRFAAGDVALGPGSLASAPSAPAPAPSLLAPQGIVQPCSPSCQPGPAAPPAGGPGLPTPFPFVPPVLP